MQERDACTPTWPVKEKGDGRNPSEKKNKIFILLKKKGLAELFCMVLL